MNIETILSLWVQEEYEGKKEKHLGKKGNEHRYKVKCSWDCVVFGVRANILQRTVQGLAALGEKLCSGRCKHVFRKNVSKTVETTVQAVSTAKIQQIEWKTK